MRAIRWESILRNTRMPSASLNDVRSSSTKSRICEYKTACDANHSLINGSDRTPGHELEAYLNEHYGPGNEYYEDFCTYIRRAVKEKEGWVATIEMDGSVYTRSCSPLPLTRAVPNTDAAKLPYPMKIPST